VGVDPGPLTLRELVAMAEERRRHDWSIASNLMALVANTQRDRKRTRPFRASDFNPFSKPGRIIPADVSVLKDVFIRRRTPTVPAISKEAAP